MDPHTLELLEFPKVRELLAGYATSSLGKDLARQIEPMTDPNRIRSDLALVTQMVDALGKGPSPPLAGLRDVRLLARRAAIGSMLSADQLLEVAETLTCCGNIYRYRMRLDGHCRALIDLLAPVEDLGPVAKAISGSIDARGHVLDMASPELAQVRQRLADVDTRVQNQIKRLLRDPELRKILRYPNATVIGDHYVLPVAVNHRHKLPGVVHRTSPTGETVFIEPAGVATLSAERALLKSEEEREIQRVLRRLTAEVARVARPLTTAVEIIAQLDVIAAKARFSRDFAMTEPQLNLEGQLWLRQARHPILEHLVRSRGEPPPSGVAAAAATPSDDHAPAAVVPIDVRLGHTFNLLIITGPNTGGKTVTLKTTGLLCAMAQAGMHIPAADGSSVPVFRHILADIGDEQSLEQSLSTFSSHMSRIAAILRQADAQSLVLLDELGAGTDPAEGAALGRAILDELDRIGCRAMVTTHLGDLKTYAFTNPRAENAAVQFDPETLRPTYVLQIGQYGMSNALQIARRLKLPRGLIRRAQRYLRRKQRRAPALAELQRLRQEAEQARAEALAVQHEAARQRDEYAAKAAQLQREAEEAAALRVARARLQPNDWVHVARFDQPGRIVRVDHKRNLALVSVGLGQWEIPLDELFPTPGSAPGKDG
ncbi:MAG: DNA strand exchange inhibitor protein [Gemmataceae bacterium]|nr:DNA strand exchange inhibitor protein [Gemmataceae bacterium]MDW8265627.1 DNA strand exchange inhibitor protein [Gemmataceae bacterium]